MAEEKERKGLPQVDPIGTANIDYIEVLGEKAKDLAENYIEYLGGKLENIFPLYYHDHEHVPGALKNR